MSPAELEAALGTGEFRFRMGLSNVPDVGEWLASRRPHPEAAEERRRLLATHGERFGVASGITPAALGRALDALDALADGSTDGPPAGRLVALSQALGIDFVLVDRARLEVVAVAVAFPSGWAPEAALGRTVGALHAVVPGLAEELDASIERFVRSTPVGRAYGRTNVGLAVGDTLDRHPASPARRATPETALAELRLRVEEQCFVVLDEATLLFLVHVRQPELAPLVDRAETALTLRRWLAGMPDSVARYKGVDAVREPLIARLDRTLARPG